MNLNVRQEATLTGKDWWRWAVWLDGSANELDQISHVVYNLHPTFPTPVRLVDNRKANFRLDSAGWGEFEIYMDIVYNTGQIRKRKHYLKLGYPKPDKRAARNRQAAIESESSKKPVLFLSSSVADTGLAGILRRTLSKYGISVVPPEEILAGVPFEQMVEKMISNANIAVFLFSGRPNMWMNREIEEALAHKVRMIVPVLVGTGTETPSSLRDFKSMQVNNLSEIENIAQQIAEASLSKK